ncbi:hypothetical protein CC80DRAFT_301016 [Byssothecium circinans]|uniref:Uncharacterized protein n=1 Tax=Byssothecium circinans TaxID=147558 RepID=A0A6A5T7L0_9PLEO|nr:hypothetical protein CC80DRAFT_301016 [Byssothecium circinans]
MLPIFDSTTKSPLNSYVEGISTHCIITLPFTSPATTSARTVVPSPPVSITPNKAGHCTHLLHPGTPQTEVLCPVCKIRQLLNELQPMTSLWQNRGAPFLQPQYDPMYYRLRKVWYMYRASLARYMYFLEIRAEREEAWELEHEGVEMLGVEDVRSARKALGIARRETPFLELGDGDFTTTVRETGKRGGLGLKR